MFSDTMSQGDGVTANLECGFCNQPNPSKFHTCEGKRQAEFEQQQKERMGSCKNNRDDLDHLV